MDGLTACARAGNHWTRQRVQSDNALAQQHAVLACVGTLTCRCCRGLMCTFSTISLWCASILVALVNFNFNLVNPNMHMQPCNNATTVQYCALNSLCILQIVPCVFSTSFCSTFIVHIYIEREIFFPDSFCVHYWSCCDIWISTDGILS